MLVKTSAIKNTGYVLEAIRQGHTLKDMDGEMPFAPAAGILAHLDSLDVPVVISDGRGHLGQGVCAGFVTCDVDTDAPAMLMFVTPETNLESVVETSRHELVHVKQVLDGRMRMRPTHFEWEGMHYPGINLPVTPPDLNDAIAGATFIANLLQYYNQPWEREAIEGHHDFYFYGAPWIGRIIQEHGSLWPEHWRRDRFIADLASYHSVAKYLDTLKEGC